MHTNRLYSVSQAFHYRHASDTRDAHSSAEQQDESPTSFHYIWATTLPVQAQAECSQPSAKNLLRKNSNQKKYLGNKNRRHPQN